MRCITAKIYAFHGQNGPRHYQLKVIHIINFWFVQWILFCVLFVYHNQMKMFCIVISDYYHKIIYRKKIISIEILDAFDSQWWFYLHQVLSTIYNNFYFLFSNLYHFNNNRILIVIISGNSECLEFTMMILPTSCSVNHLW